MNEQGQWVDNRDGKPFSTEFAFTRFLVPELCRRQGIDEGWVLFCDGDFLFLDDIENLWKLAESKYAVMVVKHQHEPMEGMKMDGFAQTRYLRKNWSSLILWNVAHKANRKLTDLEVNYRPGWWLHALQWCEDKEIGQLPESWNWLAGWSSKSLDRKAIHYTEGGPWMEGHENCEAGELWTRERHRMLRPNPSQSLRLVETV